jgi:UDP-N-acetylmuramate dehydrogenase
VQIETEVALSPLTTMGVGGNARFFARAHDEEDVRLAFAWARENEQPVRVLGGGSNIVVSDRGVDGLVLAMQNRGVEFGSEAERQRVSAAAGESWDALVSACVGRSLAGLECLSGIPGLVGATPIQNVGAYGQEVKDSLVSVRAFDREARRVVELAASDCEFAYRDSRFKSREPNRFVITSATFELRRSERAAPSYPELVRALAAVGREPTLSATRETVLALRRGKSMVYDPADPNHRSCGSFFLNPIVSPEAAAEVALRFAAFDMPRFPQPGGQVKLSAAWLIERAGIEKGSRVGNVGISSRHALALICREGAGAEELLQFAARVQKAVLDRTGVALSPEPSLW